MSRFNVCYRYVASCESPRPSHAFIDFHWCVEAMARLTGEPFASIFERLGKKHGFGRRRSQWPNAEQLRAAVEDLRNEREEYLKRLRILQQERRRAKRFGRPYKRGELEEMEARRARHNNAMPSPGYWGWRALREGG